LLTPVQSISLHIGVDTFIVTVAPVELNELASKCTWVVLLGTTVAKVDPPEEVAQCVRSFQLPEPPTQ
jgi:hypothetical protein